MIDGVIICPELTLNLTNYLHKLLENSNIWENLKFKRIIQLGNKKIDSSFIIKLYDDLFDIHSINDLLLSPMEQISLNNVKLKTINIIKLNVTLINITGLRNSLKIGNLIKDLNFAMFENFLYLESKLPLIFNYVSRLTYYSSKDIIPSIVSSCVKSNETYIIEQRSVLAGLIKNLNKSKTWIQYVHEWDHNKVKKEFSKKKNGFTITWFST
jgi:hypothetical protein